MSNLSLVNLLPKSKQNNKPSNNTFIGIDFGTSTTVVSIIDIKENQIMTTPLYIDQKLPNGSIIQDKKIPTCLAFSKKYNELYCGLGAYESRFDSRLEYGKNVWFEFKTHLGEDIGPRYPSSILDGKEGRLKIVDALDATTVFLKYIREEVEKNIFNKGLETNIQWSISVPASFEANQRKDLLTALKSAGIYNIRESMLIDEPNAAFLSYVNQSQLKNKKLVVPDGAPITVLVFDFGAGTCDISILQLQQDDFSGVKSKNVSISKYTEIGGKDIDKKIANFLVEKLVPLEQDTPEISSISSRTREKLTNQLLRIAEELKIELCNQIEYHKQDSVRTKLETLSSKVGVTPQIKDDKGRLYELRNIELTYGNLEQILEDFISLLGEKSVFIPIKSALENANLNKEEIDYVLFVGGSAKNPLIQDAIKIYFKDAEYLFPDDLQTLVSEGAAINSFFYNGLNHKLINPITGPSIKLRLANGNMKVLIPSGTEIPFESDEIHVFKPQRDNQECIELPICLTSDSHILQNLIITPNNRPHFSISDKISLSLKITTDKALHVAAKVNSGEGVVVQLNPYSSRALSTRERIAAEGRKRFNQLVQLNGGDPSPKAFVVLGKALEEAEERKEAAEIFEEAYQLDKKSINLNNLGVLWSNAGYNDKACYYYRKAFEEGNVYAGVNLANNLKFTNPNEYKNLLERCYSMNPTDNWVLYCYGKMLKDEGNINWKKNWEACLISFLNQLSTNELSKSDTLRAIEISQSLNYDDETLKFRKYLTSIGKDNKGFNEFNMATETNNEIKIIE